MPYHPSNPTHLEAVGPHGAGVVVVGQHQRHCGVATLVLGAGQGPVHIARKAVQLDGAGAKLRGGTRGGALMAKCEAPNQRCGAKPCSWVAPGPPAQQRLCLGLWQGIHGLQQHHNSQLLQQRGQTWGKQWGMPPLMGFDLSNTASGRTYSTADGEGGEHFRV